MPVAPKLESSRSNLRAKPYAQASQNIHSPRWKLTHRLSPTADTRSAIYHSERGVNEHSRVRNTDKSLKHTTESSFKVFNFDDSDSYGGVTHHERGYQHIDSKRGLNDLHHALESSSNNIETARDLYSNGCDREWPDMCYSIESSSNDVETARDIYSGYVARERLDRRSSIGSDHATRPHSNSIPSPKEQGNGLYGEDSSDWDLEFMIFPELEDLSIDKPSIGLLWNPKDHSIFSPTIPEFSFRAPENKEYPDEGPKSTKSRQCLSPTAPQPELTAKIRPAFGLEFPFDRLPYFITNGFELLNKLYTNHYTAHCIAECIWSLQCVVDTKDPAVELALIMVTVLGCPTPLPKVVDGEFQKHTKYGRDKTKWRAVLFIKMMWYRYRSLMTPEVKERFTSYQGQQTITSVFLLKIGWVVSSVQPGSRPNKQNRQDLKLIPERTIKRKLEKYKKLIKAGDSLGLARNIFDRDDTWAGMALDGSYYI